MDGSRRLTVYDARRLDAETGTTFDFGLVPPGEYAVVDPTPSRYLADSLYVNPSPPLGQDHQGVGSLDGDLAGHQVAGQDHHPQTQQRSFNSTHYLLIQ